MSEMETPVEDAREQEQTLGDNEVDETRPGDAPEADAIEQHQTIGQAHRPVEEGVPVEADEADAAEQKREVGYGEDDYR